MKIDVNKCYLSKEEIEYLERDLKGVCYRLLVFYLGHYGQSNEQHLFLKVTKHIGNYDNFEFFVPIVKKPTEKDKKTRKENENDLQEKGFYWKEVFHFDGYLYEIEKNLFLKDLLN